MSLRDTVDRLFGSPDADADTDTPDPTEMGPSHVCQSCGEEYYTDRDLEIRECRSCGGVKVEAM